MSNIDERWNTNRLLFNDIKFQFSGLWGERVRISRIISRMLLLAGIMVLLSACSSTQDRFIGVWESRQASQVEGKHFKWIDYTKWIVEEKEIRFYKSDSGDVPAAQYSYERKSKNEIRMEGQTYGIETNKKTLILKSSEFEIQFDRAK